jgi:hypothetical protein
VKVEAPSYQYHEIVFGDEEKKVYTEKELIRKYDRMHPRRVSEPEGFHAAILQLRRWRIAFDSLSETTQLPKVLLVIIGEYCDYKVITVKHWYYPIPAGLGPN